MKNNSHVCKHKGFYSVIIPIEQDSASWIKELREKNDIYNSLSNSVGIQKDITYWQLDESMRKTADKMWEEHITICEECSLMRCSEHCGNTVREAQ